jgi:hypothetical protein
MVEDAAPDVHEMFNHLRPPELCGLYPTVQTAREFPGTRQQTAVYSGDSDSPEA